MIQFSKYGKPVMNYTEYVKSRMRVISDVKGKIVSTAYIF